MDPVRDVGSGRRAGGRRLTAAVRWLTALVLFGLTFWWAPGLAVAGPGGDAVRLVLAGIYTLAGLVAIVWTPGRHHFL